VAQKTGVKKGCKGVKNEWLFYVFGYLKKKRGKFKARFTRYCFLYIYVPHLKFILTNLKTTVPAQIPFNIAIDPRKYARFLVEKTPFGFSLHRKSDSLLGARGNPKIRLTNQHAH